MTIATPLMEMDAPLSVPHNPFSSATLHPAPANPACSTVKYAPITPPAATVHLSLSGLPPSLNVLPTVPLSTTAPPALSHLTLMVTSLPV